MPVLRFVRKIHIYVKKLFVVALVFLFTFSPFSNTAFATVGVPEIISHQGRLLDTSGNLLGGSSGTNYCFRFSFYDDATIGGGDVKLWPTGTPSTMTANVKSGVFNVGIGDTGAGGDTLDFNFQDNDSVYLNTEVAAQVSSSCVGVSFDNLSPRQRVNSSGFAINASTVGGFTPSQSADGNDVVALTSDDLILGGTNPDIAASGSNTLTLQGAGATGALQFFSSSNSLTSAGAFDVASTIQSGSSNVALTLATGFIDADALTLTAAVDGGTGTSSGSGLIARSDGIGLLQGCANGDVLGWVEATDTWDCTAVAGGSGDITSIGDVTSGAAFDGTQGTTLTFNDADGDQTLAYDTTNNEFDISDDVNITGTLVTSGGLTIDATTESNIEAALDTLSSVTTVGALNAGSITSGFGAIDTGADNITTTGVVSTDTLTLTNTGTLNGLDAIDATSETTLEAALDLQDIAGAVTDSQVPNTITIDLATLASTVTVVDGTDSTSFVGIYDSATGSLAPKTDGALTYDATTGALSATSFVGAFTGSATDLNCTDCINATEIEDIYTLNSGDTITGALTINDNNGASSTLVTIGDSNDADSLTIFGDLTVTGGDIVLGTTSIFSGGDTASLNNIDAIDSTTEATFEAALDIAGDISGTGLASVVIGADKVLESHLKAVDAAGDEECLTFESTVGDFEWQSCGGGATTWDTIGDAAGDGTIEFASTEQIMNFTDFTDTDFDGMTYNFDNHGGTAGTDSGIILNNAVSTNSTGDVDTENLLLLQQLDTTTSGTTDVDNFLKIDVVGSAGATDGIEITNSGGNLATGINIVDTAGGTITTGLTLSGTFTTGIDAGSSIIVNIGNSGTDFDSSGGLALASNLTLGAGIDARFTESGGGTDFVAFQAPAAITSSVTWTLPSADTSGCFKSNGSGTVSIGSCGDTKSEVFTADGTYTKPADALLIIAEGWGSGGGGAGGSGGATSSVRSGGGGGGAGGYNTGTFLASEVAATETVTVPAGGAGGTGDTTGNDGTTGANSIFGSPLLVARGGGGGGNTATTGGGGGGGGGLASIGSSSTNASGGAGGSPGGTSSGGAENDGAGGGGGGTAAAAAVTGGVSATGGGGGGSSSSTGGSAGAAGGGSYRGAGGGAGGGTCAITTCTSRAGGTGGGSNTGGTGGGGTAGTGGSGGTGGNGDNGAINYGGEGGGGGGNNSAGAGGAGGDGGTRGGAGGGGGAGSTIGGDGGDGGRGEIRIWTLRGAGADLAEIYPTHDETLESGDVVSIDPNLKEGVMKSTKAYDHTAIGIVSTEPGLVIGDIGPEGGIPTLIALSGRVPVKVNLENGPIVSGDLLTPSTTPGVAMKATKAGIIIGQALTSYDGSQPAGYVVAFIKNSYGQGSKLANIPGLAMVASSEEIPEGGMASAEPLNQQALQYFLTHRAELAAEAEISEIYTDRLSAGLEIITPLLITDTVDTSNIISSSDLIKLANDSEFFGRPYFNADTAGFAVIKAGAKSVDVTFDQSYLAPPIVNVTVSLENTDTENFIDEQEFLDQNIRLVVTRKTENGFTVFINTPATSDIKLNWTALAVRDPHIFFSEIPEDTEDIPQEEPPQIEDNSENPPEDPGGAIDEPEDIPDEEITDEPTSETEPPPEEIIPEVPPVEEVAPEPEETSPNEEAPEEPPAEPPAPI